MRCVLPSWVGFRELKLATDLAFIAVVFSASWGLPSEHLWRVGLAFVGACLITAVRLAIHAVETEHREAEMTVNGRG